MNLKRSLLEEVTTQFRDQFVALPRRATPQASHALLHDLPAQFANALQHRSDPSDRNSAILSIPTFFARLATIVPAGQAINVDHIRQAIGEYVNRSPLVPAIYWPYDRLKV